MKLDYFCLVADLPTTSSMVRTSHSASSLHLRNRNPPLSNKSMYSSMASSTESAMHHQRRRSLPRLWQRKDKPKHDPRHFVWRDLECCDGMSSITHEPSNSRNLCVLGRTRQVKTLSQSLWDKLYIGRWARVKDSPYFHHWSIRGFYHGTARHKQEIRLDSHCAWHGLRLELRRKPMQR